MKKKKILFIYKKEKNKPIPFKRGIHVGWVEDCKDMYNIHFWGKGFTNTSLQSLKNKIDSFNPDFIYMTMRKVYCDWLPDLTNITVPKIFVSVDTYKWNRSDGWYNQFDEMYCRSMMWKPVFYNRKHIIGSITREKSLTWKDVPIFRWSAPIIAFSMRRQKRKGIYFMGSITRSGYTDRKILWSRFRKKIFRNTIRFRKELTPKYWNMLHTASALICPTESDYGAFIPAKLFEFAASGAAVITNCDYVSYGMPDLKGKVIDYTDLDSLEALFKMDFTPYYGKAAEVMKSHTHKIRYRELFG